MTPEDRLVGFALRRQTERAHGEVLEKAVHLLLDAVSLGREAVDHAVVRAALGVVATGAGPARCWGTGERLAAGDAAFVNGTATHAFFADDTDMSAWAHPASLIVPAVVAAAEHDDLDVSAALDGLVSGYAALSWLAAREEVSRSLVDGGFRGSPTLGAVAAAVGAATVLRLDEAQTLHAIGVAADSTGGLLEPVRDGAQDWRLQNGFAAQRGLVAALLARGGVRGPSLPLTGPRGFLAAFRDGDVPAQWTEDPDERAVLGVWAKPYPILGDNMAPAVAASTLTGSVAASDVESLTVTMNAHFASYPGTSYAGPYDRVEQAIASTAFGVAAVLVRGPFAYRDYDHLLTDPDVLRVASLVTVVPDASLGYLEARVDVATPGGVRTAVTSDAPSTLFFRDRSTTVDVLRGRAMADLPTVAEELFAAVDGSASWPDPSSLSAG